MLFIYDGGEGVFIGFSFIFLLFRNRTAADILSDGNPVFKR